MHWYIWLLIICTLSTLVTLFLICRAKKMYYSEEEIYRSSFEDDNDSVRSNIEDEDLIHISTTYMDDYLMPIESFKLCGHCFREICKGCPLYKSKS